jgi:uncharacterized protein with HEPN domain
MQKPDTIRVQHMLDACREAVGFVSGKTRTDLEQNRMLVLSLVKEVEIIGEAASKVSAEVREEHPEIPWQEIVLMRNRLIHAYFDVDLDVVWETLQQDIPVLEQKLHKILNEKS